MLEIYNFLISLLILQRTDASCNQPAKGVFVFGSNCLMCHCRNNEQCDQTTGECPFGCAKFWYGPGCQYRDIAEGELSRHSDNLPPEQVKYSFLANDGDPMTCSHTAEVESNDKKVNPFWRVWFPTNETIGELQITTTTEKMNYFKNFTVFVEYLSPAQKKDSIYAPTYSRECYKHESDGLNNVSIIVLCNRPEVGNQVKIELGEFRTQLVLCDVKINGGRNIVFGRNTSQNSTHNDCKNTCISERAVDGLVQSNWQECAYTADQRGPWWEVDLGHVATIWYIRILLGANQAAASYQLEVSNGTSGVGNQIYDVTATESAIINMTLDLNAKIVKLTRKTQSRRRLEICEVYVFGDCPENLCGYDCNSQCHCKQASIWDKISGNCTYGCKDGWSGSRCNSQSRCSEHCKGGPTACSNVNGHCLKGCASGWKGQKCKQECKGGTFGVNCDERCSDKCQGGAFCNKINGSCPHGCKQGFVGNFCNQTCTSGYYGEECKHKCSEHCVGAKCDQVDGRCTDGCFDGWEGENCDEVITGCDEGRTGQKCSDSCSPNCKGNNCDTGDGHCSQGCKPGYIGPRCNQNCTVGLYGDECSFNCSDHCIGGASMCSNVDGRCFNNCKEGWKGMKCDTECNDGFYGINCSTACGNCKSGTVCHKEVGTCSEGCEAGFSGDRCLQVITGCDESRAGQECLDTCSPNCKGDICDTVDGHCSQGCKPGYKGSRCNQNCTAGFYGDKCSFNCSEHCIGGANMCSNIDGRCFNNCKEGWKGMKCDTECNDGFYGINCSMACGNCKSGTVCHKEVGSCNEGCEAGFSGDKCLQECDESRAGQECLDTCSPNCKGDICDTGDGHCSQGCKPGYKGPRCNQNCTVGLYGDKCSFNCSDQCLGGANMCSNIDGRCFNNCKEGWKGMMCDTECNDGFYGFNCSMACGNCKSGTVCHKEVGSCNEGCEAGFSGDRCLQAMQKSDDSVAKLAGIIAGVAVFVAFGVIAVLYCKQRKKRRGKERRNETIELPGVNLNAVVARRTVSDSISTCQENTYNNEPMFNPTKSAIPLSNLLAYVKANLGNNFSKQFQEIPYGMKHPSTVAVKPYNRGKNRYRDMYAYDHTRVMLGALPGEEGSDYINANYIKGHFKDQAYIAAQGPTETTVDDFWRMIWENNIHTIAMVTNLVEEMKMKCLQYWPAAESSAQHEFYTVYTESESVYADFTIRKFKVSCEEQPPREICQFNFTAWPDKSVPRSTSSLLQFWRKVRRNDENKSHTWLVHCSAGVGRTGTFIALDILYDQGNQKGFVDVYQCVRELRDQRVNMVQTKDQYIFLHGLMIEAFILPSEPVPLDNFHQAVKDLNDVDHETGKTNFLSQFETMDEDVTHRLIKDENKGKFTAAKLEENRHKNRYKSVLPPNEFRPFLITNIPGCTNYINAVFIPSYCNDHGYIITQTPMENTAIDCCRLVYEQEVKVIVTFPDNVKKQVGEYLPENGTIKLGPFTVTKMSEEDENSYVRKTYAMAYNSEECQLTQLIYKCWPADRITPSDPVNMLHFMQEVECNRRAADNKPVLVQCLDGSEKSGLFATLMNILERARLDNEVLIPQVIRQLRIRRKQLIPNFEQFKFCYDVLLCHVESKAMYANM